MSVHYTVAISGNPTFTVGTNLLTSHRINGGTLYRESNARKNKKSHTPQDMAPAGYGS
nr:MAG TPA_asm: hypothetical protein [Caudoviricetes sp.]